MFTAYKKKNLEFFDFFVFLQRGVVFGPGLALVCIHSRVPSHFCAT